jgi:hypothetical protein
MLTGRMYSLRLESGAFVCMDTMKCGMLNTPELMFFVPLGVGLNLSSFHYNIFTRFVKV